MNADKAEEARIDSESVGTIEALIFRGVSADLQNRMHQGPATIDTNPLDEAKRGTVTQTVM